MVDFVAGFVSAWTLRSLLDRRRKHRGGALGAQIIEPAEHTLLVPVAQPVPLSERLPGPEDCTAQGWCWVFYQGFATWALEPPLGQDGNHTGFTHWLPANALPTPEAKP